MKDEERAVGGKSHGRESLGLALEELAGVTLASQELEELHRRLTATKRALAELERHLERGLEPMLSMRLEEDQ